MNQENSIQLAPQTPTSEAVLLPRAQAVRSLRIADDEQRALDQEIAERTARIAAERAAAIALQSHFASLKSDRAGLLDRITSAERELQVCLARVAELDAHAENNFDGRLQELIEESLRQSWLASRLPSYIAKFKARVADLDKQIAAFQAEHFEDSRTEAV